MSGERIVREALVLLEEEGLDNFSVRNLTARLGIQAPSLYWHVGSKGALLSRMSLTIYVEAIAGARQAKDWRSWLTSYGKGLRQAILARRDGARLCVGVVPPQEIMEHAERFETDPHLRSAMDVDRARRCFTSVCALALGWALYEQSEAMGAFLAKLMNLDRAYAESLEALVSGFALELRTSARNKR